MPLWQAAAEAARPANPRQQVGPPSATRRRLEWLPAPARRIGLVLLVLAVGVGAGSLVGYATGNRMFWSYGVVLVLTTAGGYWYAERRKQGR